MTVVSTHRACIVDDPAFLLYDFGPHHPLRPERNTISLSLLEDAGLWRRESERLSAPEATRAELQLVHDPHYVDAVQAGSGGGDTDELGQFGIGPGDTPAFPGMHEVAARIAGGSIAGMRALLAGELDHVFNPAGGLHHAHRDRASGFCIYNDPAIAAAIALTESEARVMYIDLDCHHGDGVQWLFYDEPRVLTVSFHETGQHLFPGTGSILEIGEGEGAGYSVNMPFLPGTGDESWLEALYQLLPPLADAYKPDIIISSHGADTHMWDPLTDLSLTTNAFFDQARLIHDLAHEYCAGRWLAVGSGGYEWRKVVPRSWAIIWAEMAQKDLCEELPARWLEEWEQRCGTQLPRTYRDSSHTGAAPHHGTQSTEKNRRTLREVKDLILPLPNS